MVVQELYAAMELADIWRVHLSTVRRWIRDGQIQILRLPGRSICIPASEVDGLQQPVGAGK